ncbi:MAG: DUF434 domain-containing protein [Bacteroidota bacterium]
MSHKQRHRGAHSNDPKYFADRHLTRLNQAVEDLSWLFSRKYPHQASVKIVGDRYRLAERQRKAIYRAACGDEALLKRPRTEVQKEELAGQTVAVDGFNILIGIECGLSGGLTIRCRDGSYRDIASVHSTYRKVEETLPALELIGQTLEELSVEKVHWFLDRPISNSGRLKGLMYEIAEIQGFNWEIDLVNNPDKEVVALEKAIAVSSDGWVLDHAHRWFNLHRVILGDLESAWIIDLQGRKYNFRDLNLLGPEDGEAYE